MKGLLPVASVRPTLRSSIYVVVIALLATTGIVGQSPWPVLIAALLTLPACVAVVPCYYILYGLLALIPGANPSSNSGSESQSATGATITSAMTGAQASWFVITTQAIGILAFTIAAILNVILLRAVVARRRNARRAPPDRPA